MAQPPSTAHPHPWTWMLARTRAWRRTDASAHRSAAARAGWGLRAGLAAACVAAAGLSGCGQPARLTVAQGSGSAPELPAPQPSLVPTVRVASAVGWPAGAAPTPAPGLRVQAFASGLNHPRWLYTLPNGDVLVAESNAPAKPDQGFSLKAWVTGLVMAKAGAAVPSPDRILLLRDTDGDGVAETRSVFIAGLHSPLGLALVGSTLYIANTDAVVQVPYNAGETQISARPVQVMALPAGPINHHWTKNLIASADGRTLYITVGSNSNVAERGMAVEAGRAAIHALDLATGQSRLFATGLRNPNGLAWVPAGSGQPAQLWTVVNERDELGSDLVPDYMTSVREGGFYGWPYSYFGQHVDSRVQPQRPELVASALVPDYALGPHTASLGLHWLASGPLAEQLGTGLAIGQHGSWNRDPPSGYRVVLVKFANGAAQGLPQVLLDGFLSADLQKAYGRPVGLAQDRQGALLVADDVGNTIWRLSPNPTRGARP